ncbi:MAG: endonuclease/exonuclease/phosphatase family protein [Actinomycetota bacterium]|nr:endonuclease/exonuclease/phosphatase family protein [Actinomycetota bacterium]
MRITSWNILHGMAIPPAPNQQAGALSQAGAKIAAELSPEVIAIQECDYLLARTSHVNQIAEVATSIAAKQFAVAPSIIGTPGEKWRKLNATDPTIITDSEDLSDIEGGYGIALASTIEVIKWHRLDLGNAPIGMPLLVPGEDGKPGRLRPIYIRDEPRVALAATLANGVTVINTHLSFVPGYNIKQLRAIKRWAVELESEMNSTAIIVGDLNLPKNLPVVASQWRSLATQATYPSWGAKIQFDYILTRSSIGATQLPTVATGVSDHLPLSVELKLS